MGVESDNINKYVISVGHDTNVKVNNLVNLLSLPLVPILIENQALILMQRERTLRLFYSEYKLFSGFHHG